MTKSRLSSLLQRITKLTDENKILWQSKQSDGGFVFNRYKATIGNVNISVGLNGCYYAHFVCVPDNLAALAEDVDAIIELHSAVKNFISKKICDRLETALSKPLELIPSASKVISTPSFDTEMRAD